jgi:branched-chain amino acid transport system ATP-binding protein
MDMEPIIEITNLTKRFGGVLALNGVTLRIHSNEIVGLIGPNGSGKTSLINCITGFTKPDTGTILYRGVDITGSRPPKIAEMGIGRTFQIMRPFYTMPAYKNLIIPLFSRRARRFEGSGKLGDREVVAIDILEELGFERDAYIPYKLASALPLGYLKRLEIGRCMALRSDVMLFDEVFSGLSSAEIATLSSLIERLRNEGTTILMIEHRLSELFRLADRVIAINYGEKIYDGSPEAALENNVVKEAYFGKGREAVL